MCSLNGEELEFIPEEVNIEGDIPCKKCGIESIIKLNGRDVFCEPCFINYTTHKFRATLGKSKLMKKNDNILIAHSGKLNSTALINLIKSGMKESVHKRLVFSVQLIYIDDGMIKKQILKERQKVINEISNQIKTFDFQTFVLPLSSVLLSTDSIIPIIIKDYSAKVQDCDQMLIDIFNQLSNDTAKIDLLKQLRKKLLILAAKYLKCSKIFVAEDSTNLAVSILSNISLGRGSQLSNDAGFIDNRDIEIPIFRPMKDFTKLELQNYLTINHLVAVETGQYNWTASIQQLTKDFVIDLNSKFSGTVSTIFKTGQKVCGSIEKQKDDRLTVAKCILCCSNLDTKPLDDSISAIDDTTFSKLVSSQGTLFKFQENPIFKKDSTIKCDNCNDSCNNINKINLDLVKSYLCYGCNLIIDKTPVELVPTFLIDATQQKLAQEKMYQQINDFLLE